MVVKDTTDESIKRRMRFACRKTKATSYRQTNIQNKYYSLLLHGKNGFANAPQLYVIRALPVFLSFDLTCLLYRWSLSTSVVKSNLKA